MMEEIVAVPLVPELLKHWVSVKRTMFALVLVLAAAVMAGWVPWWAPLVASIVTFGYLIYIGHQKVSYEKRVDDFLQRRVEILEEQLFLVTEVYREGYRNMRSRKWYYYAPPHWYVEYLTKDNEDPCYFDLKDFNEDLLGKKLLMRIRGYRYTATTEESFSPCYKLTKDNLYGEVFEAPVEVIAGEVEVVG